MKNDVPVYIVRPIVPCPHCGSDNIVMADWTEARCNDCCKRVGVTKTLKTFHDTQGSAGWEYGSLLLIILIVALFGYLFR